MGAKYTNSQKEAIMKYQAERSIIKITVSKEEKHAYQNYAQKKGLSMTQIIKNFFDDAINQEQE